MPAQAGQHVIRPVVRPGGRNHSDAKCNLEVVRSDYHSLAMDYALVLVRLDYHSLSVDRDLMAFLNSQGDSLPRGS